MPMKWWRHDICGHNPFSQSGSRYCPKCGQEGTFLGWGYSMMEEMGAYQGFYGLKSQGPHIALAHKLLKPLVENCVACDGRGVVGPEGEEGRSCEACYGFGRCVNCERSVFLAARQQVLQEFPEAEAPIMAQYG